MSEQVSRSLGDFISERREPADLGAVAAGEVAVISKIGFDGKIELRSSSASSTNLVVVRPGDLVLSGINALKGAASYIDPKSSQPLAATIHYSVYSVGDEADVEYLWRLLRTSRARFALDIARRQGIKSELRPRTVLGLRVNLPTIRRQRELSDRARTLDTGIEHAVNAASRLETQADEAYLAALDDYFGGLAESGKFSDVLTMKPRSGPAFLTDPDWTGQPVAMPSAVTGFRFRADRVEFGLGNDPVRELDVLRAGDILIARGNKTEQVGNAAVVPPAADGWVCANLLMRTRVDPGRHDPRFFVYWLQHSKTRSRVRAATKGTSPSIQKINQAALLALPAPIQVDRAEQRRLADALDNLRAQAEHLSRQAAGLRALLRELHEATVDTLLGKALQT